MDRKPGQFYTYKGKDGQFYWRLKGANGKVIADGAEGYTTRYGAVRALRRVKIVVHDLVAHWS